MESKLKAILACQHFFFRSMARCSLEKEGLFAASMGISNLYLNSVHSTQMTEEALLRIFPEVESFFDQEQVPWSWIVTPDSTPNSLAKLLIDRGLSLIDHYAVMAYSVTDCLPEQRIPSGYDVQEVETAETFDDWCIPLKEGFASPEESTQQFKQLTMHIPYGGNEAFHHYVLYGEAGPMAAGTFSLIQGNARLDNIAVRPTFQRQGLGRAMTLHLMREAIKRGAVFCFLDSSSDGQSLYQSLGFATCYIAEVYGKNSIIL